MKSIIFFLLTLFCSSIFHTAYGKDISCQKWEVVDISFRASAKNIDPFATEFGAVFLLEDGTKMNVPGFYNDDNNWVIRFCPAKEGVWTFKTYSTILDLNKQNGSVTVLPNTKKDRHGAVKIHPQFPQRFSYEDGTTYFPLAFEMDWLFALDAENDKDIPRTRKIVHHLVENNFNKVMMNVYAYEANWGEKEKIDPKYNFAKPSVFPFAGNNKNPDHSSLDIDFFKHFDRVMAHLNDAHSRLVTVHDYNFCRTYPNLVDFISIQEWRPNLYNQMLQATKTHSAKPVFNVEHGGYEQSMHSIFYGAYIDPVVCLERSYTCIFAGTYTTYYWQNSSWYEVVYEPDI